MSLRQQASKFFKRLSLQLSESEPAGERFSEALELARELDRYYELYHTIIENAPFGVAIHDNKQIHYINERGAEIVGGGSPEEIVGRPLYDYLIPEQTTAGAQRVSAVVDDKAQVDNVNVQFRTKKGAPTKATVVDVPVEIDGLPFSQVLIFNQKERITEDILSVTSGTKS